MRKLTFAFVALTTLATLAGCLDGDSPEGPGDGGNNTDPDTMGAVGPMSTVVGSLYATATPLWNDPQNAPHPAYNWPTLSFPAVGDAPDFWSPIAAHALPESVTGIEHIAQATDVPAGAGIALFGSIAVVPEDASTAHIVDVSDPTDPHLLSSFDSGGRGAAVIAYPDGRLVTVLAATRGIEVVDITDPTEPVTLNVIEPTQGSHKLGVVPGTPIVYNAASCGGNCATLGLGVGPGLLNPALGDGVTEIYDLTDPENPVHVQDWANGYACHHVFFWNSVEQDRYRAICAGMEYTQIWDTKDPAHPEVIVSVPVHYGVANGPSTMLSIAAFSHSAGLNQDGTVLYVGDENMGGGLPPGCGVGTDVGGTTEAGTPIGSVWFYDITTETMPLLQGYFEAPRDAQHQPSRSCTAHHGRIIPDPDRDILAMGFYNDGIQIIDFTDPTLPVAISEFIDGTDTWEVWYDQGYVFTGDLSRGMDVFQVV